MVPFPRAVAFAHRVVEAALNSGGRAVDATCGNGHDTAFLATCVGAEGMVAAFDVQPRALEATRARLEGLGMASRVRFILDGHEHLLRHLDDWRGRVSAVVFNLGYLPGSDKNVMTSPETTIAGLRQGLALLQTGGVLTATVYPGHPGGREEAHAVETLLVDLPQESYTAIHYGFLNEQNDPPAVLAVSKLPAG